MFTANRSKRIQPIAERFPALEQQEVEFTFDAPDAKAVQVAGSFNRWNPEANPMQHIESGEWTTRLMLKAGQYEYLFVVDGEWVVDPRATESAANSYGGLNSVLRVGLDDKTEFL